MRLHRQLSVLPANIQPHVFQACLYPALVQDISYQTPRNLVAWLLTIALLCVKPCHHPAHSMFVSRDKPNSDRHLTP